MQSMTPSFFASWILMLNYDRRKKVDTASLHFVSLMVSSSSLDYDLYLQ